MKKYNETLVVTIEEESKFAIKRISEINNISSSKLIRSLIDNFLNEYHDEKITAVGK